MDHVSIIRELSRNQKVFGELVNGLPAAMYTWRPSPEKWCLLEVFCHLYDEEREDFRARVKHVLESPDEPMTPIDPVGWVSARDYMGQDFETVVEAFLKERQASISWLESLVAPQWDNTYQHPKLGPLTARLFLSNWLAHDYIHIRQILKVKFAFLQHDSGEPLTYAGNW